jgi:hypothetical protein
VAGETKRAGAGIGCTNCELGMGSLVYGRPHIHWILGTPFSLEIWLLDATLSPQGSNERCVWNSGTEQQQQIVFDTKKEDGQEHNMG